VGLGRSRRLSRTWWGLSVGDGYPDEILRLFTRLGVDPRKEGEAYWTHRRADGLHHYGGWVHFIGSVVQAPLGEAWTVRVSPAFSIWFNDHGNAPRLDPLRSAHAVQVEFEAAIPWNCDRQEPEVQGS
jgi:hypothetical protein